MKKYSAVIVDDEPHAAGLLALTLAEVCPLVEAPAIFHEWSDALKAIREHDFDLIFMDISMPGKSGIDLLKLLPSIPGEVIFVTAHQQYAVDAFRFEAAGYILKPVSDEELAFAVEKAIKRLELKSRDSRKDAGNALDAIIGIPNGRGIEYINRRDILYLHSVNKCTQIVTTAGALVSAYNLSRFRDLLASQDFFQVHRSYIVNLHAIRRYLSAGSVVMTNGTDIPVSRSVRDEFLHRIGIISKAPGQASELPED